MKKNAIYVNGLVQEAFEAGVKFAEANMARDAARFRWLEAYGGMIGIRHIDHGEYAALAGEMFDPLGTVVDRLMAEHAAKINR